MLTQNQENVTGPLSLTYNGVTIDAVMSGSWGSDRDSDPSVGQLRIERQGATTLPGCQLFIQGNAEFRGFRHVDDADIQYLHDRLQQLSGVHPPGTAAGEPRFARFRNIAVDVE